MNFRDCTCGFSWKTREDFLGDPNISIVGYQVNFEHLREGFFLFNHLENKCFTTMSIQAAEFLDLYNGTIFQERREGSAKCSGQCLHQSNLAPCPAQCECAYVLEVVNLVKNWPKRSAA
ncbi:MAG: hypothetical protein WCL49_00180 [bacterium]